MFTKPTPPWIIAGGLVLTCSAGTVNAVGFLGLHHQAISHLSGTVTNFGVELAAANTLLAFRAFAIIASFFLGAVLSGLVIRQSTLRLGRRYGAVLVGESALLFLAAYFLRHGAYFGDCLAAMACGLQNAMATSYSGAVIRTTHLTGIITDLGIALGLYARGEPVDGRRIRLYLVLLFGFFSGGVLGALSFAHYGSDTLVVPATLAGVGGFAYIFMKFGQHPLPIA